MGSRRIRCALAALALVTCGCTGQRHITVGSKNFTEQIILGEIVAQKLEMRLKQPVDRKLDLGGTLLTQEALRSGQIDVYPEYTGTALTNVLKLPPSPDAGAVFREVKAQYRQRWHLEWLDPLGFDNSFAIAIRGADARARHIRSLSDAARRKDGWRLGAGYEFLQRPDGLPGLQATYHLPLKGSPVTMDLGLLYPALQQNQVDMAAGSATDGMLSVLDVQVLEDDRHSFPPYQAALVARADALSDYPGMLQALQELSGKISTQTMRKLNYEVDGRHRAVRDVAREFLAAN